MNHHILMGDPSCFSIKRGANPHTRNRWGWRKKVDLSKAIDQWHRMKETLERHDIKIHVVPPHEELPGLVFPANAGVRIGDQYIMASLNPARDQESAIYEERIRPLGLKICHVQHQFEGEADLIPWGDRFILTHGKIERQRFVVAPGFPPWKRIYGFRTDVRVLEELAQWIPREKIIPVELKLEEFYHGDTIFCTFGAKREYLLAYRKGIKSAVMLLKNGIPRVNSWDTGFRRGDDEIFKDPRIILISETEAHAFFANSFQTIYEEESVLFMPVGSAKESRKEILNKGVRIVELDVSEFFEKGGGSVKCMIGDLGLR